MLDGFDPVHKLREVGLSTALVGGGECFVWGDADRDPDAHRIEVLVGEFDAVLTSPIGDY